MAFAADRRRFNDKFSRTKFQHNSNVFQRPQNQNQTFTRKPGSSYYCTNCKINGHSIERCFKIHGFPPGFKSNRERNVAAFSQNATMADQTDDTNTDLSVPTNTVSSISTELYNHLIELLGKQNFFDKEQDYHTRHALLAGKMCLMSSFSKEWFLNSGATDHISPYSDDFVDLKPVFEATNSITIPDGSQIKVTHVGSVILNDKIILTNVLLVPAFQYRLLSVHKLCEDLNSNVIFSAKQCHLQDLLQKHPPLLLGELNTGLYTVAPQKSIPVDQFFTHQATNLSISDDSKIWHLRLGHISFS